MPHSIEIFWSEANQCFLGECREFPECTATGNSMHECLARLLEAIDAQAAAR